MATDSEVGFSSGAEGSASDESIPIFKISLVPNHENPDDIVDKLWSTVEQYQTELEEDGEIKDGIRVVVKEIEKLAKRINFGLTGMHSNPFDDKLMLIGSKASVLLKTEMAPLLKKLEGKIPAGDYYKYNDLWRYSFQKLCTVITLTHYLVSGTLPTLKEVVAYIEIPPVSERKDRTIFLDYDEYLFGLLELANELSRLCRNIITFGGRTEKAHQIHQQMIDLSAAMHNITFKNDYLRKKYDGLKYQIKTVEEVMYDLKIQKLKIEAEASTANSQAGVVDASNSSGGGDAVVDASNANDGNVDAANEQAAAPSEGS